MNTRLIYWTLNSAQEGFFLDSDIQFHRILRNDEPVKGREEVAHRLAEMRPHHQAIWVDTPEVLHRIGVEMKTGERDLDARPLAQITSIIQQTTPHWSVLSRQARLVTKLIEQYERGQINQFCLLRRLVEDVTQANEEEQRGQSQYFTRFLCELADAQLM